MFFLPPIPPPAPPFAALDEPLAPCPLGAPPLTTLVSSHPFGPQLSLVLDTQGNRAFVADGAVITILDLTSSPPGNEIATIPVPDCQPLAQLYWQRPGEPEDEHLFLAGGSHGLWHIPLESSGPGSPELIDEIVGGYFQFAFQRKRCVDLVVLDGVSGANAPVLVALYAASDYTTHSGPNGTFDLNGPTEIRAYKLLSGGILPLSSYEFSAVDPTVGTPPPYEVGTALAVDPVDQDSVWVGMGKGGIYRADLSGTTIAVTHVPNVWTETDYVADLAIVRADALAVPKSYLYAAMNFVASGASPRTGTVLEYDLSAYIPSTGFPSSAVTVTQVGCSRPWRVSALVEGTHVRVAVAQHPYTVLHGETVAPAYNNGFWIDVCPSPGVYEGDDEPQEAQDCSAVEVFGRDLTPPTGTPPPPTPALTQFQFPAPLTYLSTWGSLFLRKVGSQTRLFACTSEEGTTAWDLSLSSSPPTASVAFRYVGVPSIGAQKGTVTESNPDVVRFGLEGGSAAGVAASMVHIGPGPDYAIAPIDGTVAGCGPPPCTPPASGTGQCEPEDTSPYLSAILGEAQWIQEGVLGTEYFLPPFKMMRRVQFVGTNCDCTDIGDCDSTWAGPCTAGHRWYIADLVQSTPEPLVMGWRVLNLTLLTSGAPSTLTMMPDWKQLQAPRNTHEDQSSEANDLGVSIVDPRRDSLGFPVRVYGIRQGTSVGLKVFRPRHLVEAAGCGGALEGFGERIDPPSAQALTHIELAEDANQVPLGCVRDVDCNGLTGFPHSARHLFNNGGDTFAMRSPTNEPLQILAVAAGFPGGEQINGSSYTCTLAPLRHHPMIVLYDVSEKGPTLTEPVLLKVAIGEELGSAFDVKVKQYTTSVGAKYYAFVADVTGRLIVFDVSYDKLFPPTSLDQGPYPFGDVLDPEITFEMPKDGHDGYPPNMIDIEVEGDYLYAATGRAGVAVFNVGNPTNVALCALLDTPGLALGIAFRTVPGTTTRQMIVGDSRCGIRIYE